MENAHAASVPPSQPRRDAQATDPVATEPETTTPVSILIYKVSLHLNITRFALLEGGRKVNS